MTRSDNRNCAPGLGCELIVVGQVAERLRCSKRHVLRLCKRGVMPAPVRLGALLRWQSSAIDKWIESGCPRSIESSEANG